MAEVPFEQKIHIDAPEAHTSMDPGLAALIGSRGNGGDGMFGSNGIMGILALGLLGNGGLFGNRGQGAEALAIANTVGGADILAAVNAANLNTTAQLGNTSREILSGQTDGFRDLVDQTHGVEVNVTTAISNLAAQSAQQAALSQLAVERSNTATQLGICNLGHQVSDGNKDIQLQICQSENDIAKQLAECCCKQQLATQNVLNQLSLQHCELKGAITADGAMTRALITQNRMDDLQAQLNDAKSAVRDANIIAALSTKKV